MMQSALQQDDLGGFDAKKLTPLRIVTYRLADGATHEYLYLLDNPNTTKTAVSEITALSNTTFLVDERDGNFPPAYKRLFLIDLAARLMSDRRARCLVRPTTPATAVCWLAARRSRTCCATARHRRTR